jgi:aspartyl-tRNA(Asn)/glutamyl-tRNA(Gln) amidotransferase subunit A
VSGPDPRDATSVDAPVIPWVARPASALGRRPLEGVRVGVPAEYFGEGLSAGVAAAIEEGLRRLEALGATRVAISLPHTRFAVATYYVLATAEASSNLARYDGVRFGDRAESPGQSLGDLYRRTRGRGFGSEVKRRIILGTFVLSAGYYDAYYRKAERVRALIRRDFDRAFESVDVIATPTSPDVAFPLGEKLRDPLAMYLADVCTLPASLAGLPGLSVPCGLASGLPVGLQLVGRFLEESRLYDVAHAFLVAP